MTRMLLVDLIPVLGIGYLTDRRSRSRRGRRFKLSFRPGGGAGAPVFGVVWVVTTISVIALVVAPNGGLVTSRGLVNTLAVWAVMMLVQVVGAVLHNKTRARR